MRSLILVVAVLTGCALRGAESDQPLAVREDGPCRVELRDLDLSSWQQVRGPGFLFCVPADWEHRTPTRWAGESSGVGWHPGRLKAFTSDREVGQPPAGSVQPTPGKREHFTESIGGVIVQMWRTEVGTRHEIGGQWVDGVTMYMVLTSNNPIELDRHADVLRTVRVTGT